MLARIFPILMLLVQIRKAVVSARKDGRIDTAEAIAILEDCLATAKDSIT